MPQNMTPEEIQAEIASTAEAFANNRISVEEHDRRMRDAARGVRGYTEAMESARKQMTNAGSLFAQSLYKGTQGMDAYSNSVDAAGDAALSVGKAFGPLGIAVGALVKAFTFLFTAASKQSDALFKSYQDISRVGVAFDGLEDLRDNMQKLGYGIDDLAEGSSVLTENVQALASLSGTVATGSRAMADMAKEIRTSAIGTELQTMGYSIESMNKGIGGYLRLQQQVGRIQLQTNNQLMEGAAEYLKSADQVSKVTGLSLKQQMDIEAKARARETFGAYARQQERMGKGENVKELQLLTKVLEGQGLGNVAEGIQDLVSGAMGSPEARKAVLSLPGMMAEVARQKQMGKIDAEALHKVAIQGLKASSETFDGSKRFGAIVDTFDSATYNAGLSAEKAGDMSVNFEKAREQQANATTDSQLKNQVELRTSQREIRDTAQDVVSEFGELVRVTSILNGILGGMAGVVTKTKQFASAMVPRFGGGGKALKPGEVDAELLDKLTKSGITDKRAQANILAQVQAESGGKPKSENLNYKPEQLLKTFPKYIKDMQDAQQLVAQGPEAVGNRVYGGRMGNQANEGFMYRGRGLIQLTGKDNYAKYGKLLGIDLVGNPDLANDPSIAKDIATAYFAEKQKKGVNLADIAAIGKAVGYVDIGGQETQKRAQLSTQYETKLAESKPVSPAGPSNQRQTVGMPDAKQTIKQEEVAKAPPPDQGPAQSADANLYGLVAETNALLSAQVSLQKKQLSRMS